MSADLSGEQMQAKITAARREAEGLKDRIKRKKDDLADTTRKTPISHSSQKNKSSRKLLESPLFAELWLALASRRPRGPCARCFPIAILPTKSFAC